RHLRLVLAGRRHRRGRVAAVAAATATTPTAPTSAPAGRRFGGFAALVVLIAPAASTLRGGLDATFLARGAALHAWRFLARRLGAGGPASAARAARRGGFLRGDPDDGVL